MRGGHKLQYVSEGKYYFPYLILQENYVRFIN